MIASFAPSMLRDDDAIDFVAHQIMRADWRYDNTRLVKDTSWRYYAAKKAVQSYAKDAGRARKRTVSLNDFPHLCRSPEHVAHEDMEEGHAVLMKLLDMLTPLQRHCVVLHHLEGRTPSEIATETGMTRQGVRKSLNRSMQLLKRYSRRRRHE
jgi:RNA polymerase sigma factor (sigma-70 family)